MKEIISFIGLCLISLNVFGSEYEGTTVQSEQIEEYQEMMRKILKNDIDGIAFSILKELVVKKFRQGPIVEEESQVERIKNWVRNVCNYYDKGCGYTCLNKECIASVAWRTYMDYSIVMDMGPVKGQILLPGSPDVRIVNFE